ncbi:MAG: hypothetical protein WD715_11880 [Dongiaceae bacterium]
MKTFVLAAFLTAALTAPAFAFHCPADMADIDAALAAGPDLTADQLAEVERLRTEGEVLHDAGDHQGSVDALAEAKAILGIE